VRHAVVLSGKNINIIVHSLVIGFIHIISQYFRIVNIKSGHVSFRDVLVESNEILIQIFGILML
jgi:hypothetical protein